MAALRRFVEKTSPRGLEASVDPTWRDGWDKMERAADLLADGEYVIRLRRLLGWFKEGHTTVLPFEFLGSAPDALKQGIWGRTFPLRAVPFHDGLWVTEAKDAAAPLLGAKILRAGGIPIERIVARHIEAWPAENPAWGHAWAQLIFNYAGALHGLGVISGPDDAPVLIQAARSSGELISVTVSPSVGGDQNRKKLRRAPTEHERYGAEIKRGNFMRGLAGGRALYVSIDDVSDLDGFSFAQLTADILTEMRASDVERVVIDLRRNGGGDNYLSEPLRHELERSRFSRPGGMYVLTGPLTFSAGQNLANRLERETFAIFAGEPTGSAPNLVGDPSLFVGETTGLTAMVATLRWFDSGPSDKRRWIFPDLFIPSRFADWAAGRDPALEAVLAHEDRSDNDFRSRARYFERESQKAEWKPFWA